MPAVRIPIRALLLAIVAASALALVGAPPASTAKARGTGVDSAIGGAPRAHMAASGACASASVEAGGASNRQFVRATLCRVNQERTSRGMKRVRLSRRLGRAARRHAGDMVQRNYFAHDSLGGGDFVGRIRRTGYLRSAGRWVVGENLAWGAGDRSSPEATVQAWMDSPPHRANILKRRFREVGIGVVFGAPVPGQSQAATYATDFGRRR
jgi:uncharacterized protein YkwD